MTQEEITALAREYAEWVLSVPGAEKLPNCLRNEATGTLREDAEEVLTWLSTRFCLVEKSKVQEEYIISQGNHNKNGFLAIEFNLGRRNLLDSLFPELAKEVEE